jgi:hypothetical protein
MKQNMLTIRASFVILLIIVLSSCSNPNSKATAPKAKNGTQTLTAVDPYSANAEWAAYREEVGMYALHLKPSINLLEKQYEIKEEEFFDGKKKGELIFKADKLGYIRDGIYNDSCLHFYAFRKADTGYNFQFSPIRFGSLVILLSMEKENLSIYRWTALYEDSKKMFELKDSTWKPIFALTLPYKELCTPDECFYCVLPENVDHYQDWGTTMKIKHYYIFSIRVL